MDGEKSGSGSFNFEVINKGIKIIVPRKQGSISYEDLEGIQDMFGCDILDRPAIRLNKGH